MDTAYTTFITQDNDYIIELSKRRSIFSPNRVICNITFKNILKTNATIIFISHRIDNMDLFDRMIEMKKGKIIKQLRRK